MEKWNELNDLIQTCYSLTQKTSIVHVQYQEKENHQLILSIVIETQLYQYILSGQKSLNAIFSQLDWIDNEATFIYWFQENFTKGQLYTTMIHPRTCSISIGETPHNLTLSCPLIEDEAKTSQFIQSLLVKLTHHIRQQSECRIITSASLHTKKQSQLPTQEIHAAVPSHDISNSASAMIRSQPKQAPQTQISRLHKRKTDHPPMTQSKKKTSLINPGVKKSSRSKTIQFEDPEDM